MKRSRGFTLIEVLLVIGVIGVLAIAAILVWPQTQAANRAQLEKMNVTAIAAGIKQAFMMGTYEGLDTGMANRARVFPKSMNDGNYDATQPVTSSWSEPVEVGVSPTNGRRFTITYRKVPDRICEPFARYVSSVFDRVSIGGTDVKNFLDGHHLEYEPIAAVNLCVAADGPHDVVVETQ